MADTKISQDSQSENQFPDSIEPMNIDSPTTGPAITDPTSTDPTTMDNGGNGEQVSQATRSAEREVHSQSDPEFDDSYKSISRGAVVSVCMGLFAFTGFLFAPGAAFAVLGICAALYARYSIRKYPQELTGRGVAKFGMLLSLVLLLSTSTMHTYIYFTEVPPDHERLTFGAIKAPKHLKWQPPKTALEMNGKQVFIKGYTFPGKQKKNLSKFLLVGDFGDCCFGGNPEPSHLVRVSIKNGRKIDYSQRVRKLSGTFRVLESARENSEGQGYLYEIVDANILK